MNLVDILARELKKWPEGLHGCDSITQDDDGLLNSTGTGCVPNRVGGAWRSGASSYIENGQNGELRAELSCDWDTAIVTRAQWQAAVDTLKAGEQAWDGEGLPPIGTVCEYNGYREDLKPGQKLEVIYHFNAGQADVAAFVYEEDGSKHVGQAIASCFRPIRTAEQIWTEELREIIESGLDGMKTISQVIDEIIDAGYRKQVQP